MTDVEEFILENQASICVALFMIMPDKTAAQVIYDRAELIRNQINRWKKHPWPGMYIPITGL